MRNRAAIFLLILAAPALAQHYAAPAGLRPAVSRPGQPSILPGGRIIAPIGQQFRTGPGPFGIAVSPDGNTVISADGGPRRYSLTVLDRDKRGQWDSRHIIARRDGEPNPEGEDWRSVFMGLAFETDRLFWASEGNSGRVRLLDTRERRPREVLDLNQGDYQDSYTGDMAMDRERRILYVVDQANFRVAVIDARRKRLIGSVRVGRLPFAAALSPDGSRLYVTNIGMFQYSPVPGADPNNAAETGLPFPAFGFPSEEAEHGAIRETARGPVEVPGLGDPNAPESNSVCVINVENPEAPVVERFIRTGTPLSSVSHGGSSPSGVAASADRVYVANAHNDSVTVIDAAKLEVITEIPLRIQRLENLRGVLPIGLAVHPGYNWLLVAEAGLNAVGVIDLEKNEAIGHIPVAWFPTAVAVHGDTVFVTNAKGHGTGPNATRRTPLGDSFMGEIRRGSISVFPVPGAGDLRELTGRVYEAGGFIPKPGPPPPLPEAIRYVVLIVKENRTFDEVFGDIEEASNGKVAGAPPLARFGRAGFVSSGRQMTDTPRLALRKVNVTPNHHKMADLWAFSHNFYADAEVSVDGHHWLVGSYPNAWTESSLMASYGGHKDFRMPTTAPGRLLFPESNSSLHPEEHLEAGAIWHHFERHGITFRNYGEGFELAGVNEGPGLKPTGARLLTNVPISGPLYLNTSRDYPQYNMNIPDQYRATEFIREVEELYVKGGQPLPRFLYIHLPNDHLAQPRPEDGYPYEASFMMDNDYALGRILAFLSRTPWWKQMAVFITEDDAQGYVDHIDSHRTLLLVASPYAKKNYVSSVNSSFPGLLKTVFRLLGMPALNLFDAVAADLSDCFTDEPDFAPYDVEPVDPRVFVPEEAREPLDPKPSPRMDDPRVLREQHQRR